MTESTYNVFVIDAIDKTEIGAEIITPVIVAKAPIPAPIAVIIFNDMTIIAKAGFLRILILNH